jgi:hypothetical protein
VVRLIFACVPIVLACGHRQTAVARDAEPSVHIPAVDAGSKTRLSIPPLDATLRDGSWELSVHLDPAAPAATLAIGGQPVTVSELHLSLEHEEQSGMVSTPVGPRPTRAVRMYRLRFVLDGLHGHPTPYELLVDVKSSFASTVGLHQLEAACVPRSGAGPLCSLLGAVQEGLSDAATPADRPTEEQLREIRAIQKESRDRIVRDARKSDTAADLASSIEETALAADERAIAQLRTRADADALLVRAQKELAGVKEIESAESH